MNDQTPSPTAVPLPQQESTTAVPATAATPATTAVPVAQPAPSAPSAVPSAPKPKNTLLIVLLVIIGLVVLCCGGTVVAWFVAKQQVSGWLENMGLDLSSISDDFNADEEEDDDDDLVEYDEDGSSCITTDGAEGIWYIHNDFDGDGKIDADECEPIQTEADTGFIEGTLMFPSEFYPSDLEVCAEDSLSGIAISCTDDFEIGTSSGLYEYSMELPVGDYYVYAHAASLSPTYKAYYSEFVVCGLEGLCHDHTPVKVSVTEGSTTKDVDASDWYN